MIKREYFLLPFLFVVFRYSEPYTYQTKKLDLKVFTKYVTVIMSARQTQTISNSLAWQGEAMNENNLRKIAKEIKRDLHADNKHTSMLFDLCVDGAIMATKDYLDYYMLLFQTIYFHKL